MFRNIPLELSCNQATVNFDSVLPNSRTKGKETLGETGVKKGGKKKREREKQEGLSGQRRLK